MGQQFCSQRLDLDAAHDLLKRQTNYATAESGYVVGGSMSSTFTEQHAFEVAKMIADDRSTRPGQTSSELDADFAIREPSPQDFPHVRLATHRTTGMVRRVVTMRKPCGEELQERLRVHVRSLQALHFESVARILEVYENCRTLSLVMEHCSGGTVYERILSRQFFSEQESAVLIRSVLQSLAPLHRAGLPHGHPTPDSFRFQNDACHSSLKLTDFGIELRLQEWDICNGPSESGSRHAHRRTTCLHFYETCRLVFCSPEVVRSLRVHGGGSRGNRRSARVKGSPPFDAGLLQEAIDSHLTNQEALEGHSLEAADAWSVGAIAFLLLCGYPPFFAPCRHVVFSRVAKIDYSFDPPFWSKISEEAKDFVQKCLCAQPEDRMSVLDALRHPWIQHLADNSPSGCMLSSFALNLRRFYRTSLIEIYTANALALKLSIADVDTLFTRLCACDTANTGFFTATELKEVLADNGHADIAESLGNSFARMQRQPGESYIDYLSLMESVRLRREHRLEEDLWNAFAAFKTEAPERGAERSKDSSGHITMDQMRKFLQAPASQDLLSQAGIKKPDALISEVLSALGFDAKGAAPATLGNFLDVAIELVKRLPPCPPLMAANVKPAVFQNIDCDGLPPSP
mmetsp:Transcript_63182/g.117559  ORF Transcript_63182/g.117559 Transcript_63182/m.117559 type:complete len:630 (-) Transcript_63182:15-1904(-)